MQKFLILLLFLISSWFTTFGANGEVILCQDDFDTESNNQPPTFWTSQAYCKVTGTTSWSGPKSVNTRNVGYMQRACSTAGYGHVFFGFFYRVDGLETGETCVAEYSIDGGSSWITAGSFDSSRNGAAWQNGGINLPSTDVNATNFVMRFRSISDSNTDYCYWDTVAISVF